MYHGKLGGNIHIYRSKFEASQLVTHHVLLFTYADNDPVRSRTSTFTCSVAPSSRQRAGYDSNAEKEKRRQNEHAQTGPGMDKRVLILQDKHLLYTRPMPPH